MPPLSDTDDIRTTVDEISIPIDIIKRINIPSNVIDLVSSSRKDIANIIHGNDNRLLVIAGPCSIHDPVAAMEYARMLVQERERLKGELEIVMRVYFEKPRTTVGWKGLINDPRIDGTNDIQEGLYIARKLLIDIINLGLPVAVEYLDVISPQFLGDLVTWGAIGARTTESQVHRELASGLSSPVGFKNGTDGNTGIAVNAMKAAMTPQSFLGVSKNGKVAIVNSRGNPDIHMILRGGNEGPNYDNHSVQETIRALREGGVNPNLMIDLSHANRGKEYKNQMLVGTDVAGQIREGNNHIMGVMIESHLVEGSQSHTPGVTDPEKLTYGQSITDPCIGVDATLKLLELLADATKIRENISSILNPK